MSDAKIKTYADFALPSNVVTRIDISRLVREVERVDNEMSAAEVRSRAGSQAQAQPLLSEQLTVFLNLNDITLDKGSDRTKLIKELRQLKEKVPVLHMTFAVTADAESLEQLTKWVRSTIHPQAVIDVGLQPGLVAGVYLRTPNHVHDFSMRGALQGRHGLLVEELEALRGNK